MTNIIIDYFDMLLSLFTPYSVVNDQGYPNELYWAIIPFFFFSFFICLFKGIKKCRY